jgi:hypothetical protein
MGLLAHILYNAFSAKIQGLKTKKEVPFSYRISPVEYPCHP